MVTTMANWTDDEIATAIRQSFEGSSLNSDDWWCLYRELGVVDDSDMARVREPDGWAADFTPHEGHPGTLWADLTDDEAAELHDVLWKAGKHVMERVHTELVEAAVAATIALAHDHPDLPRGRYQLEEAAR